MFGKQGAAEGAWRVECGDRVLFVAVTPVWEVLSGWEALRGETLRKGLGRMGQPHTAQDGPQNRAAAGRVLGVA